jgi:EAL domain-containing protein (putative c-di-GMP-specific phosphodiesterase class I)
MFRVSQRGEQTRNVTVAADVAHEVLGQLQFDRLLNESAVTPYFQPIVRISDLKTVGYEVLARSQLLGLQSPATMFRVAAERECEPFLSRVCRTEGLLAASSHKLQTEIYLNTHPSELGMPELLDSLRELRAQFPDASVLLEVHESGVTSSGYLLELRKTLDQLGMRLAYDDFGSGQARLMELVEVPPDILKFDIKMIRDLDSASPKRRLALESLVKIVRDLGVIPLAEGTETQEAADACQAVGFELVQGFFFGRPAPARGWQTEGNRETSEDSAC